jgi:hypothetical protein
LAGARRPVQEWQCRTFWRPLAELDEEEANGNVGYVRMTRLHSFLTCWYGCAGIEMPSGVQRAQWAVEANNRST